MGEPSVTVEVAYAGPSEQVVVTLRLGAGSTVREAVMRSGILERFPEIDLEARKVGIYGEVCSLDRRLTAGDRVEIYRPLHADPRVARRQRVASTRSRRKGRAAGRLG